MSTWIGIITVCAIGIENPCVSVGSGAFKTKEACETAIAATIANPEFKEDMEELLLTLRQYEGPTDAYTLCAGKELQQRYNLRDPSHPPRPEAKPRTQEGV